MGGDADCKKEEDPMTSEVFEKFSDMVRKLAWSASRASGLDYEELFAEACLGLIEAWPRYDPERGAASTFIWCAVRNHLNTYLSKETKQARYELPASNPSRVESTSKAAHMIGKLSKEAREVVLALFEAPGEVFEIVADDTPRTIRRKIKDALRRVYPAKKAEDVFKEIKAAVRDHLG